MTNFNYLIRGGKRRLQGRGGNIVRKDDPPAIVTAGIRYRSLNWFITYQGSGLARICLDCATPVPPAAKIQLPDLRACQLAPKVGTLALRFLFDLVPALRFSGLESPFQLDQSLQRILVPHRNLPHSRSVRTPYRYLCPGGNGGCGCGLMASRCSQGKAASERLPWDPLRLLRAFKTTPPGHASGVAIV